MSLREQICKLICPVKDRPQITDLWKPQKPSLTKEFLIRELDYLLSMLKSENHLDNSSDQCKFDHEQLCRYIEYLILRLKTEQIQEADRVFPV